MEETVFYIYFRMALVAFLVHLVAGKSCVVVLILT